MKRLPLLLIAVAGLALVSLTGSASAEHYSTGYGRHGYDAGYRGPSNFNCGADRYGSSYHSPSYNGTLYRGPSSLDLSYGSSYRGFNPGYQHNQGYNLHQGYNWQHGHTNQGYSSWNQRGSAPSHTPVYPSHSGYGGYTPSIGLYLR